MDQRKRCEICDQEWSWHQLPLPICQFVIEGIVRRCRQLTSSYPRPFVRTAQRREFPFHPSRVYNSDRERHECQHPDALVRNQSEGNYAFSTKHIRLRLWMWDACKRHEEYNHRNCENRRPRTNEKSSWICVSGTKGLMRVFIEENFLLRLKCLDVCVGE